MKKFLSLITAIFTLSAIVLTNSVSAESLNSFLITDYDIQMKLGRDSDGRSTLATTEKITAQFSQLNVNHGIERAIPNSYDGHSTSLKIISVKDESGKDRKYTTSDSNGNSILRIGEPGSYAHGKQTYVIRYSQRDVTKHYSNTGRAEFYWDTNGTEWKVPIQKLSINLAIDNSIRESMTGNTACYVGRQGSTNKCLFEQSNGEIAASVSGLTSSENVTLAVGFAPETFAAYQLSLMEKLAIVWAIVQFVTFIVAFIIAVWFIVRFVRITERSRELRPIPPEYIPPAGTSVTIAAKLAKGSTGSVMTAQLIDLAVRHYIKLYEVKEKSLWLPAEYEIEIIQDLSGLHAEEKELLKDMFGSLPAVSQRMNLIELKYNTKYFTRTADNDKNLTTLIRGEYALRKNDDEAKRWYKKAALTLLISGILTLSLPLLIVSGITLGLALSVYKLTDKGLILRRYLEGLKLYIGVAEKDRLKMLQSPEGVQKVTDSVGGIDKKSLLKLYERVLPYAIIFNQEKEWSKSLGKYYEQTGAQPDWYTGKSAFNAVLFSSAISNISQASSYASSSSSSSGGSGGGGYSGGGGGGGGGGGW